MCEAEKKNCQHNKLSEMKFHIPLAAVINVGFLHITTKTKKVLFDFNPVTKQESTITMTVVSVFGFTKLKVKQRTRKK